MGARGAHRHDAGRDHGDAELTRRGTPSREIGATLLDLLLPGGCVVCRCWIPRGEGDGPRVHPLVCPRCRSRLRAASWPRCPRCHRPGGSGRVETPDCLECREWPEALVASRFAFVLCEPASDLVHALKYEGWRGLAPLMGDAVAEALASEDADGAVVVPVPTTRRRERQRGYNQASLLADRVAERLGMPRVDALLRPGEGASQTELVPEARRENVRGAFASSPTTLDAISGRHVFLVDDVLTTGATAAAAATVLSAAGARSVTLGAFARALPTAGPPSARRRAA